MRKISILFMLVIFSLAWFASQPSDPKADPKAVVEKGDVRFTVLTPQLVRMEYSPDRTFVDERMKNAGHLS